MSAPMASTRLTQSYLRRILRQRRIASQALSARRDVSRWQAPEVLLDLWQFPRFSRAVINVLGHLNEIRIFRGRKPTDDHFEILPLHRRAAFGASSGIAPDVQENARTLGLFDRKTVVTDKYSELVRFAD